MASFLPGLRRAAPRLAQNLLVCHQLPRGGTAPLSQISNAAQKSKILSSLGARNGGARGLASVTAEGATTATPLGSLSETIGRTEKAKSSGSKSFPSTSSKSVAYWLLGSAASVFGIVVFGGLTRLTESGLSITEWKPVTGSLPPLSHDDWMSEFNKYRASPEFKLLNPNMELNEFKQIYYMEWGHRLWGRFVGLSFVLPAIYFVARRKVSANMSLRLFGIAGLIGFQGVIGWWMVKSGLKDDLFAPGSHPRVSQYRLTTHLGAAFICYTAMLWNGLSILRDHRLIKDAAASLSTIETLKSSQLSIFRKSVASLALLVFITAMSGGLVAGLDAGMIYNEFPYMGVGLTPPKSELFSDFYSRKADGSDIWWRNMLENPSTVQLDHRILATTTFTSIMALWAYSRFSKISKLLPKSAKKGVLGVVHLVFLQVALGISTLLYLVPIPLAAAHQAGSLLLLSGALVLGNRIWIPKRSLALVKRALSQAGHPTSSVGGATRSVRSAAMKADLKALGRGRPDLTV